MQLAVGDKYISFTVGDSVILSRRLEGEFLNYRKAIPASFRVNVKTERAELAIPASFRVNVKTERAELLRVVERVSLIVDEKVRTPLRLTFNDDAIDFACTTPLGRAEDVCPCEGSGEGLEIGFNDRYLSDALKNAPADEIQLSLNTGSSPCILTAADGSDNFTYMILPVRLRAGQ